MRLQVWSLFVGEVLASKYKSKSKPIQLCTLKSERESCICMQSKTEGVHWRMDSSSWWNWFLTCMLVESNRRMQWCWRKLPTTSDDWIQSRTSRQRKGKRSSSELPGSIRRSAPCNLTYPPQAAHLLPADSTLELLSKHSTTDIRRIGHERTTDSGWYV